MKKWVLGTITSGALLTATTVGVGIGVAIIVPKTLKLKGALQNFVLESGSDPSNLWKKGEKLNVVALGDSETAGINGIDNNQHASYSDFLAKDLKKSNNLGSYKNFAKSGERLGEMHQLFKESMDIQKELRDADLVTFTIGANDLLRFIKIFGLARTINLEDIFDIKPDVSIDKIRDKGKSKKIDKEIWGEEGAPSHSSGLEISKKQKKIKQVNAIDKILELFKTGRIEEFVTIDDTVKEKIFDIIKRDMVIMIHDLHSLAPHAKIMVLGHAFPFPLWPIADTKRKDMNGKTLREMFQQMLNSMKEATTATIKGSADYVEFKSADKLPIYKTSRSVSNSGIADEAYGSIYEKYIKKDSVKNSDHFRFNAMPNPLDIHPSEFGYELIGNSLYTNISKKLGYSQSESLKKYTYTCTYDSNNEQEDNPFKEPKKPEQKEIKKLSWVEVLLNKENSTFKDIQNFIKNPIIEWWNKWLDLSILNEKQIIPKLFEMKNNIKISEQNIKDLKKPVKKIIMSFAPELKDYSDIISQFFMTVPAIINEVIQTKKITTDEKKTLSNMSDFIKKLMPSTKETKTGYSLILELIVKHYLNVDEIIRKYAETEK